MENEFRVGYKRIAMVPKASIPMGGFGNEGKRLHQTISEDICVICVAISDEDDSTVILSTVDFGYCDERFTDSLRDAMSKAAGIDRERIFVACTHTHSSPAIKRDDFESMAQYRQDILVWGAQAAREAMEDRKPAQMFTGSIETHNLNFIKHYKMKDTTTGEISVVGDQFGSPNGKIFLDHMTKVDPTLHLVQFTREGGKDVVLANFRAHPHFTGGMTKTVLSADFPGAFRRALDYMNDCHCIYLQGACGNVNSSTRMHDERRFTTHLSHGTALAATAIECLDKHMTQVKTGKVKVMQQVFYGEINSVDPAMVEKAREVADIWHETLDPAKCREVGVPHGIRSPYHAEAILWNLERTKEEDGRMLFNALSLGDEFSLVTYPGEMYDSISVRTEENSPYNMTMMLCYCNHHFGYLPSAVAYKYTSYETDITRFAPGTGEQVADTYVQMLRDLKEK